MVVHNENPDEPITLPAGTKFTGKENGKTFVSKDPVLVPRAKKVFDPDTGKFLRNDPGLGRIYVEAQKSGTEVRDGHAGQLPRPGPHRHRRPQHVRHRARSSPWTRRTSRGSRTPTSSIRSPRSTSRSTR